MQREAKFTKVKIEVYLPVEFIDTMRFELNKINALTIGNYDNCMSITEVTGYWKPMEGSNAFKGEKFVLCSAPEKKLEFRCSYEIVKDALEVIKRIHPYEEPVIDITPLINNMFLM